MEDVLGIQVNQQYQMMSGLGLVRLFQPFQKERGREWFVTLKTAV